MVAREDKFASLPLSILHISDKIVPFHDAGGDSHQQSVDSHQWSVDNHQQSVDSHGRLVEGILSTIPL